MEFTITPIDAVAIVTGGALARLFLTSSLDFAIRRAATFTAMLAIFSAILTFIAPTAAYTVTLGLFSLWFVVFCAPTPARSTAQPAHEEQNHAYTPPAPPQAHIHAPAA